MRIFPENTEEIQREDYIPGEVHISGMVGIDKKPEEYEFDVEGKTRALASYLVADIQKMKDVKSLDSVLEDLKKVDPISFKWDNKHVKNAPSGPQFGFKGNELWDVFEEVVRITSQEDEEQKTYSVAYQNLVPVLVKAVQELSVEVETMKEEIKGLKEDKAPKS